VNFYSEIVLLIEIVHLNMMIEMIEKVGLVEIFELFKAFFNQNFYFFVAFNLYFEFN
jgi:hypothetical protein